VVSRTVRAAGQEEAADFEDGEAPDDAAVEDPLEDVDDEELDAGVEEEEEPEDELAGSTLLDVARESVR
jgi:hypothetical protein